MAAERVVSVRLQARTEGFVSGMRSAKKSVDDLSKADVQKPQKAFSDLADKAALMGVAVGAGIGVAVKRFADFDKAMSAVKANSGATGAELDALRAKAMQLGADSQFSATEAAQGINELAKAGVQTQDILQGGLKGALDLAAAGQIEVGQAAETTATALNLFNLKGDQASHVADLLAAGASKAQGGVSDMALALDYAGGISASLGISIEETAGTLGYFASQGIIGEKAGTSYRSMLLSLTAPSKVAAKQMAELGINVYDASGNFIGMQGAANELQRVLAPLDQQTRTNALGQIFGNESINAAIKLYEGGGDAVAKWTKEVNENGFAAKQAADLTDNLTGDVERLGGALDSVFIQTGSSANGALRTLVQGVTGLVDTVGRLPGPLLLAGAGLAGTMLVVPRAIGAYKDFGESMRSVGLGLENISTKAPRTGKALSAAAKGAGLAAKAFGALAAASVAINVLTDDSSAIGVESLTKDLLNADDAVAAFSKSIKANAADMGFIQGDLENFGNVLRAQFDPDFLDSFSANGDAAFNALSFGLIDLTTTTDEAGQRLKDLDGVLSGLVQGGNGAQAEQIFGQFAKAAEAQGVSVEQLMSTLPQYKDSLASVDNQQKLAEESANQLATANEATAEETEKAAKEQLKLAQALVAARDAMIGASNSDIALAQANTELAKSAEKVNGATNKSKTAFDLSKKSGQEAQSALNDYAATARKAAEDNLTAGDSTSKVGKEMDKSRAAFIKAAEKMGLSGKAARDMADDFGLSRTGVQELDRSIERLPKSKKVDVNIRTSGMTELQRAGAYLAGLRDKRVTLTVGTVRVGNTRVNAGQFADGGAIYGPGTGTSDSIPALLSNGEHVLTAAEVKKAGGQDAIYRMRAAIARGALRFATGGAVQRFADGGDVRAPLDDYYGDFVSSLGDKVSSGDLAKNRRALANATARLRIAESKLREDRRKGKPARTIASDELAVARARDAVRSATSKAADAQDRYRSQRGSSLSRFGKGLGVGVKNTASFIGNIQKIAGRGFVELAQQLAQMSNEDAERIAAQAAGASTGTLRGLSAQVSASLTQQQKLDHIQTIAAILGQVRSGNLSAREMAEATGIDVLEILDAAALIRGELARNRNGSRLLADVVARQQGRAFAVGGAVTGPGSGTSDSVPAWLSNGEHVWTAGEVAALGGQSAMYALRAMVRSGSVPRFAAGGAVQRFAPPTQYIRSPFVNGGGAGAGLPDHVTLVDESGAMLGRMRVVADGAVADAANRDKFARLGGSSTPGVS